ncbi:hypothetical protein H4Q26_009030 [Puccinia striiformis f. sp. tritici PST-130]|nr:hypothetical protein H4Q26_009030 [Puccinia striiformis f. sp. tritici PST-130]
MSIFTNTPSHDAPDAVTANIFRTRQFTALPIAVSLITAPHHVAHALEITAIKPRSVHCRSTLVGCSLSPERLQSNTKTRRRVGWAARWGSKSFESDGDEESPSDLSFYQTTQLKLGTSFERGEAQRCSQPTSDGKTGSTSQPPADVLKTLCGSLSAGAINPTPKPTSWVPGSPVTAARHPPRARQRHRFHNGSAPGEKPHSHGDGKIIPSPSPSPSAVGSKEIPKVLSEDSDVEDMDLDDDEEAPEQESVTDENSKSQRTSRSQ